MRIRSASPLASLRSSGALALLLACGVPLLEGCGVGVIGGPSEDGGNPSPADDAGGSTLRDGGDDELGDEADAGWTDDDAGQVLDAGWTDEDAGDPAEDGDAGEAADGGEPDEDGGDGEADAGSDAGEPVDGGAPDEGDEDAGDPDAGGSEDPGPDAGGDPTDAGDEGGGGGPGADGGVPEDAGPELTILERCFPEIFDATLPGPDYDQFAPIVGSHCRGTDHQNITGVERVVFLGDSITVGSPPTLSRDFYRSLLADELAAHFGLAAPEQLWRTANLITGGATVRESGDFASCAKWGARAHDLTAQLNDCLPSDKRGKRTLVVLTIGGNDLAKVAKDGRTASHAENLNSVQGYLDHVRATVEWLKAPGRFPNGVYVVFANVYEFTDGTVDLESCPATNLGSWLSFADFENWEDPEPLKELMIWANEEYMRIAVDTGSDMMFLFESFCGHGFHADDPSSPCYRGPNTPRWFDATCIHPNPTGHARIADYFLDVIVE